MNPADFDTQFNRLAGHFHLPADASRDTMAGDWYQAVQGYELAVLERSVTTLIRTAQDRFWPPLGRLLDLCRGRASSATGSGKCGTCHGATWIDSAPFKANGMIYDGCVVRCPDCHVPQPNYTAPSHRDGLTAIEYREWSEGTNDRDYMPEGCKAKARSLGEANEMRAAMERLRLKLFGKEVA